MPTASPVSTSAASIRQRSVTHSPSNSTDYSGVELAPCRLDQRAGRSGISDIGDSDVETIRGQAHGVGLAKAVRGPGDDSSSFGHESLPWSDRKSRSVETAPGYASTADHVAAEHALFVDGSTGVGAEEHEITALPRRDAIRAIVEND